MSDAGTANLINLVLTVITAASLGVTVWQTYRARASSRSALESARQAADSLSAAQESAAAQKRTAEAMEQLKETLVAQGTPAEKWEIRDLGGAHFAWHAVNRTGQVVAAMIFTEDDNAVITPEDGMERTVQPGEALQFAWNRRLGSPTAASFRIGWRGPGNREFQFEVKTVVWPGPSS